MEKGKIKTYWASVSHLSGDGLVVCVKSNDKPACIRFSSPEQLKQAINSKKIKVKKWAITVPKSVCILKPLTLPASDMSEADRMVEFELPLLVPLSLEQIVYGCTLLKQQTNMLQLLVCIMKQQTLHTHLRQYEEVGIKPHIVTLDALAIQSWFNLVNNRSSLSEMNIFVDEHRLILIISTNGALCQIKELTLSEANSELSLNQFITETLNELNKSPLSSEIKTEISISGPEKFVSRIKESLNIASNKSFSMQLINVTPKITFYEDNDSHNNNYDLNYETALAEGLYDLAANSKFIYSNLLPRQHLKKSQQKILLKRASHKLELQINPIEYIAGGVESKRQRLKAIQNQLSNRGQITKTLEELYRFTPKGISISELSFVYNQDTAHIEMKGQADTLSNAFEYANAMSEADLLKKIQIINAQQIPSPRGSIVEFKANCVFGKD
jgi:hypothetical protein